MASRLYPGFGSGKGTFTGDFDVKSFGSVGKGDMEVGDKIILPPSAMKEITKLKLPFPLIFKVGSGKGPTSRLPLPPPPASRSVGGGGVKPPTPPYVFEQYAGAIEFSAPEGVVYLPRWMMENVKLREGSRGAFTTVRSADLPSGTFVKFRARSQTFLELAHAVGPREVLEAAMRNYTVLSLGERLLVEVAGDKHFLDVVEVRPGTAISVLGNVDLEVEFAPLVGSPEEAAEKASSAGGAPSGPDAPVPTSLSSLPKDPSRGKENEEKSLLVRGIAPAVQKLGGGGGSGGDGGGGGGSTPTGAVTTPRKSSPAAGGVASKIPAPRVSPGGSSGGGGGGSVAASASSPSLLRSPGSKSSPSPSKASPPPIPSPLLSSTESSSSTGLAPSDNPWDDMFPGMGELLKRNAVPSLDDDSVVDLGPSSDTPSAHVDPKKAAVEEKSRALAAERERGIRAAAALSRCEGSNGNGSTAPPPLTPSKALPISRPSEPALPPPLLSLPTLLRQTFVKAAMPTISPSESRGGELDQCPHCSALVPCASFSLHTARCARSDDLHKFSCTLCSPSVTLRKRDFASHAHCTACNELVSPLQPSDPPLTGPPQHPLYTASALHASNACPMRSIKCGGDVASGKPSTGCAALVPAKDLEAHRLACPAALEACPYCKLTIKRGGFEAHLEKCGSRTGDCEVCGKRVVLKHMAAHLGSALCGAPSEAAPSVGGIAAGSESELDSNRSGVGRSSAVGGGIKAIRAAALNTSALPVASNLQQGSASARTTPSPASASSLPPKKPSAPAASSSFSRGGKR